MYLVKIYLRRQIYDLFYISPITLLLQRKEILFYGRLHPFSGDDEPIIFDRQFYAIFFYAPQRKDNDHLLRRFINIIGDMKHFILFHV